MTAIVHVPYVLLLAYAYEHGDFSVAYPVARGSGAVFAAIGGVVLLDDDLGAAGTVAVLVVAGGMWLLSVGATARAVDDGARRRRDDRRLHGQRQSCGPVVRVRATSSTVPGS